MLSILIPTFNYDVFPLVKELHDQCKECEIEYEILVQDDNSEKFINENSRINSLHNCILSQNKKKLGRGKNINLLCSKAKFGFVLIMESDSFPEDKYYIKNYINHISQSASILFGGVKYSDVTPNKENLLRWKYGHKRETKTLHYRLKNNYDFIFTWNLLLKKEILTAHPFPEFIAEYGYEDAVFLNNLFTNSIAVKHIENFLVHHNNEDSKTFIQKTERAVTTLHYLIDSKKIDPYTIKLSRIYILLKKYHLTGIIRATFAKAKKVILYNLTSAYPNLYFLDFYKLGYLCTLNNNRA